MKKKNYFQFLRTAAFAMAVLFCVSASAKTVYVSTEGSNGNGASWSTAYTTFAAAYTAAAADDEIWVAAGVYPITALMAPKSVKIYGGFAGSETSIDQRAKVAGAKAWVFTNTSTLKSAANLAGIFSVGAAPGAITFLVDGITFDGDRDGGRVGRAINIGGSTAAANISINYCTIKNFNSNADGGALNLRSAGVTISYCLIQNNTGNKGGGGYLEQTVIHHSDVIGNSALQTGSVTDYQGNQNGGGGGLFLASNGSGATYHTTAYNCYIADNTAAFGGGIHVRGHAWAYNCIVVNNTTAKSGSGICFEGRDSNAFVYNCIIANNRSNLPDGSGVVFVSTATGEKIQTLRNSILYNNTDGTNVVNIGSVATAGSVNLTISNNILDKVYDSPLTGTNNVIESDPAKLFTNITAGNYAPFANFAGMDKGDITGLNFAGNVDYADSDRVAGLAIDMGAYEHYYVAASFPVSLVTKNVTVTTPSPFPAEIPNGNNFTVQFTVNAGYHLPYVAVNGVKAEPTEASGTYSFTISNVKETKNIVLLAWPQNEVPAMYDLVAMDESNRYSTTMQIGRTDAQGRFGLWKFDMNNAPASTTYNKINMKLAVKTALNRDVLSYQLTWRSNYMSVGLNNVDEGVEFEPFIPWTEEIVSWNGTQGRPAGKFEPETTTPAWTINQEITENMSEIVYEIIDDNLTTLKGFIATAEGVNKALSFMMTHTTNDPGKYFYAYSREGAIAAGNETLCPVLEFVYDPSLATGNADNTINDLIVATKYYTLQGVEVGQPTIGGMYIVKTIYQSGKSSSKKVWSLEF